jgi:hypothetical protein
MAQNSISLGSLPDIKQIARIMGGEARGNQASVQGPGHSPKDRSLSVKTDASAPDGFLVHSFAGDDPLACRDYVRDKLGLPAWNEGAPVSSHKRSINWTYDYQDAAGELIFQVVRYEPKTFRQRRPDGNGGWLWSIKGMRRVLYRLPEVLEAVALEHPIFIAEGEKAVDALVELGVTATCSPGGAEKWRDEYSKALAGADVVILPDNDAPGERHCEAVAKSLAGVDARVRILRLPGLPPKGDVYDWIQARGTAEQLWHLVETDALDPGAFHSRLRPICIHQLFEMDIPEREMVLGPIIPQKGLAMLYAARGIGKTHIACGISNAVATGTKFLKWAAPKPRKVLHCDGEMPAKDLRERFAEIRGGAGVEPEPSMLNILAADLIDLGIGNLASPNVQVELDPYLGGVELLVLDNLSSLTSVVRDNDAESWGPIQEWLLRLRRRGVSVLIVHHAGKGGGQRGTSRREDVLDTSISLSRPDDYQPTQGARFEVHFEKARGFYGDQAKPFEAHLEVKNGCALWSIREIEDVDLERVRALLDDGLSIRDIAAETDIPKSTVGRLKKKIEAEAAGKEQLDAAA